MSPTRAAARHRPVPMALEPALVDLKQNLVKQGYLFNTSIRKIEQIVNTHVDQRLPERHPQTSRALYRELQTLTHTLAPLHTLMEAFISTYDTEPTT